MNNRLKQAAWVKMRARDLMMLAVIVIALTWAAKIVSAHLLN